MSDEMETEGAAEASPTRLRWVSFTGFLFALLQSACTALLAVSGFRVLIGLGALAAAAGVNAPARGFHQDKIRIPMMILAVIGALVNLYSLWRVRSLRARPSARWRMQQLTPAKRRSERLQFALSIVTLVLLALEWITHPMIHRA